MDQNILFGKAKVNLVSDGDYFPVVIKALQKARYRCYCSIFIIDYDLDNDFDVRLTNVLSELASTAWRGVDTKLLIGGSRANSQILKFSLLALARARHLGLDTRLVTATEGDNSHVKMVIADDFILTGSHNWSRGIFGDQIQDGVLIQDPALASTLSKYFFDQWSNQTNTDYVVSF